MMMIKAFAQVRTGRAGGGTQGATTTSVQGRFYQNTGTTGFGGPTTRGTARRITQTRANARSGQREVNRRARAITRSIRRGQ